MPRYSQALNDILENVSAPATRGGTLAYRAMPGEPEPARPETILGDVEIILHVGGVAGTAQRFYNVPHNIAMEAIAHINDNAEV